jgi:hypothetical protein
LIVAPDGTTRRALMMIVGGKESVWYPWRDEPGPAHPDVYLRVVPRSAAPVDAGEPGQSGGADLQQIPTGWYFRGGGGRQVFVGASGSRQVPDGQRTVRRTNRWWPRSARS